MPARRGSGVFKIIIEKDFTDSYNILESVSQDFTDEYNIYDSVYAEFTDSYSIYNSVSVDFTDEYSISAYVYVDLTDSYSIAQSWSNSVNLTSHTPTLTLNTSDESLSLAE